MPALSPIIRIGATPLTRLGLAFGLSNVKILTKQSNPYLGKIPVNPDVDDPLYQSALGTPVYSDLTLGDTVNTNNNIYTDNNGIKRKFTPMTFESVLISISQPKVIEKTGIQGANGKIKEYIADDDFQITINGIIPGSNGHYPADEVSQFYQILKAPIAIACVGWWLQIFDIHDLVIQDYSIPQLMGEYSQQTFSITALSDLKQEIKFIPGA